MVDAKDQGEGDIGRCLSEYKVSVMQDKFQSPTVQHCIISVANNTVCTLRILLEG